VISDNSPSFQLILIFIDDGHLPFDPDHQSYLGHVRLFHINQEFTKVNMIALLLDPEPAGLD
jgi:hypothetical protein